MKYLARTVHFIKTENRMVVAKDRGEVWAISFLGIVSVWEDEKILELNGANGCTTMSMYLNELNY